MTIFLSTYVMNTAEDNRQASQGFRIKHFCHINLFQADRFGTYCSGCILEHVKTVTQNPSSPAASSPAIGVTPFWEHHPPTLQKKSTPLIGQVQNLLESDRFCYVQSAYFYELLPKYYLANSKTGTLNRPLSLKTQSKLQDNSELFNPV